MHGQNDVMTFGTFALDLLQGVVVHCLYCVRPYAPMMGLTHIHTCPVKETAHL